MDDLWTPDERAVRHCIKTLPIPSGDLNEPAEDYYHRARVRLESLLPKPVDPVKALVEEFWSMRTEHPEMGARLEDFARHLHSTGRLKDDSEKSFRDHTNG